jgi:cell division GTPase FtsZ
MMAPIQTADWQNQPARLLLPVCEGAGGIVPTLAAAAANLLSSVACPGIVGVDASDIWSAIDGQGASVATHTIADQGQEVAAFGRSALSAAYKVGIRPSSVRRLLISALLPSGWLLCELDELASTVANAFNDADTTFMSAVIDPSADTASMLLVCS